jgi:hypothetical protein
MIQAMQILKKKQTRPMYGVAMKPMPEVDNVLTGQTQTSDWRKAWTKKLETPSFQRQTDANTTDLKKRKMR